MTFTSPISMTFGTGVQITFMSLSGMIEPCAQCQLLSGILPSYCTWWELFYQGVPLGIEFHVDSNDGFSMFHIDIVIPLPIGFPPGTIFTAELKIDSLEPCDYFAVHSGAIPSACSWWEVTSQDPLSGYEFHVDVSGSQFHVDIVLPASITLPPPGIYEATAVQKISEIKPCDSFIVTDPAGFNPVPCTWWEILDQSGLPTGQEFHVDQSGGGHFHVDLVTPNPITIPVSYTVTVRQKIDMIQQCSWFKVSDLALIPEPCSWWKVTNPSGDIEFHVDASYPDGTFHVDISTQTIPFAPPVIMVRAERKIDGINPCDWFTVIDPSGWVPEPCTWWIIDSPQQWAGKTFHVDSNDGVSKFHVDIVDQLPPGPNPPPYSVTAEPYTPSAPSWYIKPPYADYAPSGMPDFDERQNNWYWRSWAYPDAVAVWQHFDDQYNDWDIYYSIYTDPNIWWTIGVGNVAPIVSDSPMKTSFLGGDDKQPAISWYSSNYAIAVWQHQYGPGAQWDIFYSVFTPNVGWTPPAPITYLSGDDYDPAIAFDTNGWAVCVWVHGIYPNAQIYYSMWNPNTKTWIGPNAQLNAGPWPGNAAMPEIDIDSNHKLVTIWTDTSAGLTKVYFSWAAFNPPGFPAWTAPATIPGCPAGMNWQKGISPNTLGNNLMDWGLPAPSAGQEPLYYAKFNPGGVGWNPGATQINAPQTNGEHPDLAYDFNNNAIAVYTQYPTGQIWYSFWNGANWQPQAGAFAATAGFGAARPDQWPALAFIKNNKGILVWNSYPEPYGTGWRSEIYYSVYTPTYPADSWTQAKKVYKPNDPGLFLTGDDYYVDIASPTGSATTPLSPPPAAPRPPDEDIYWTWCGPLAVANSIWWFDSKYESNTTPPPTISDTFPLVTSYNPGVWDDHDPQNVKPFVEHLAFLMDCDGMRTKLCHDGSTVWDMQAGITQYLSWSGVNPLGDVDGNGIIDQNDIAIVNAAMGSKPGTANWNLAADIYPETVTGPRTADNLITQDDLNLVNAHMGETGLFYEHTTGLYPSFSYIEEEVMRCQDVVLCLGFYQNGIRDGGHFVTVAGVNSTTYQLLISNPIRDDFEAGLTPGRSPVPHIHMPPEPPYITHNNASLVSQDAYTIVYNAAEGYWALQGYFADSAWEARIEFAVITSPYIRNIAVTDVDAPAMVNRGDTVSGRANVNVTIQNNGQKTESFFDVWVEANTTIIGTRTIISLDAGTQTTITFQWNTTGYTLGNYTIKAHAQLLLGETNYSDNTFENGKVIVKLVGDLGSKVGISLKFFAFDKKCDGNDLALLLLCFKGTAPPEAMILGDLGSKVGITLKFFVYDGRCDGPDLALFLICFKGGGP
jgi:hypothetical protein